MCLTLLLNGLVWLRIFTTPDSQLVKNSSALPLSGSADHFAVHSLLSLRPGGDSLPVSLLSSLHAAPLGWNRAIARDFSGREKT